MGLHQFFKKRVIKNKIQATTVSMFHFLKEKILSSESNELLYMVLYLFQMWKFWQTNLFTFSSMISMVLKRNFLI